VVALVYAWFATGLAPFSTTAYVALSVPIIVAVPFYGALGGFSVHSRDVASYYRMRRAPGAVLPWAILFAVALALEIAGLALGGRSADVPTLSTTIDHLLVAHEGRCALYLWWLWIALRAITPLWGLRPQGSS
jgi:hypothetical protein